MPKNKPKVSIGLPIYNGERYLEETLDSLLAQTYTDFELIIADNASAEAKDLYDRYKTWADETGERKHSKKVFGLELKERGFETQKDPKTRRLVYFGIGLNIDSEALRSSLHVTPRKSPRVETIPETASDSFGHDAVDRVLGGAA